MYKSKYEKYKLKYNLLLQQGGAGLKTYYISLIPKDITISKRLQLFYNHINDILHLCTFKMLRCKNLVIIHLEMDMKFLRVLKNYFAYSLTDCHRNNSNSYRTNQYRLLTIHC